MRFKVSVKTKSFNSPLSFPAPKSKSKLFFNAICCSTVLKLSDVIFA